MESPSDLVFKSIKTHFADQYNLLELTKALRDVDTKVSLRAIDWLVTNYSRRHQVAYILPDGRMFDVYSGYKSMLRSFSKSMFDPFKRGPRVTFKDARGESFETTVGQLNFFRWALRHGVVEYTRLNTKTIEDDMLRTVEEKRQTVSKVTSNEVAVPEKKKLHQKQRAPQTPAKSCSVSTVRVRLVFH